MKAKQFRFATLGSISIFPPQALTHCILETPKRVFGKQCRPRSDAAECHPYHPTDKKGDIFYVQIPLALASALHCLVCMISGEEVADSYQICLDVSLGLDNELVRLR